MKELQGKTAFITGGGQGIGLGIARSLATRGVKLALADIDGSVLQSARAELSAITTTETYVLDVRDRAAFETVADRVEAEVGPVSLLFNNAGIAGGIAVHKMTYEKWDWVLGVNLDGVVNGIQTFLPRMIARRDGGHVVNTASGAGLVAGGAGFLYTTSKFAVVGMSEALRIELAPFGIGVSVLCPGAVDTAIVANTASLSSESAADVHPKMAAAMAASAAFLKTGTSADDVGDMVLSAIDADELYIQTDAVLRDAIASRMNALLDALPVAPASA